MRISGRRRASDPTSAVSVESEQVAVYRELVERLHSMDDDCLEPLVRGLSAAGDLTLRRYR